MRILFDTRWIAPHGIGRVASEYYERLRRDFKVVPTSDIITPSSPLDPLFIGYEFRRQRADLYVSPGFNGSPFVPRQIFFVHDLIHLDHREPNKRLKVWHYDHVIRTAARRASRLITVSNATAQEISKRWPEVGSHTSVIYNGVSDEFRPAAKPRNRAGIAMFTNNRWHKNLTNTLAGVKSHFSQGATGTPLHLIGPRLADVERAVDTIGLSSDVIWHGTLDDHALAELYQSISVFIMCSHIEGFGLPVLEAARCGAQVVASAIPALHEVAPEGAIFVDPNSPGDIARGISEGLRNPPAYSDGRMKHFDWALGYSQLRDLVLKALSNTHES